MSIKGCLLDLDGVVFSGDAAISGSLDAIARLRAGRLPIRFTTNTTRLSRRALLEKLRTLGLTVADAELVTPAAAAMRYLHDHDMSPHLLVHPDLVEDFAGPDDRSGGKAVVIGDAGEMFTYLALNEAYRLLDEGATLLALARNRHFRDRDGRLSLDAGPFVAALEFATRRDALVLGKPSADFFHAALADMGVEAADAVMVGDDVESDVAGARAAGLAGILVQTGKYRAGDERRSELSPTRTAADLQHAVDWILDSA